MKPIATLTIGQAPRVDMNPILEKVIPADKMDHFGVLDGLTEEQVHKDFSPEGDDKILVSRLKTGTEARLGSSKIEKGLQAKITMLNEKGYQIIMLLCTGEFHSLKSPKALLIEPDRIIPATLAPLLGNDKQLGVLVPAAEQIKEQLSKWKLMAKPPVCAAASPYSGSKDDVIKAGKEVRAMGADFVVLDCMGYNETHLGWLKETLDIPVILSNKFMAGISAQLI